MRRTALLLLVLATAACAGDGSSGSSGNSGTSGGPGVTTTSAALADSGSPDAPTVQTFSPETRAFMEDGLRQFSRDDPAWPQTRAQWLALGPRESEFLVQSMWTALLKMQQLNEPRQVERARHELALIGAPSIALTSAVLSKGRIGTSEGGQPVQVDDQWRREAAEVLSIVGAPAVPALLDVLAHAETKSGRRFALLALGNMGDRGGPDASRALVQWSRDDDLLLRTEAVKGMGHYTDSATGSLLLSALNDEEALIREHAAEALAVRGDRSAVGAIRQAAARARSQGRLAEAGRIERAAKTLEKNAR